MSFSSNNTNWYDRWNVRPPVFDDRFAPDEYDPLQLSPRRGFVAGRGCPTRQNAVIRRRSDTNVLAPMRAGVDRPVRSRQNPFSPREPVRRRIDRVYDAAGKLKVVRCDGKKNAEKLEQAVVQRVAQQLSAPVDCPICMECVENPLILECGHMFCRSDLSELLARKDLKCPHCRAVLDAANITDKESFLKVHRPLPLNSEEAKFIS